MQTCEELLPMLKEIQKEEGYLSEERLKKLSIEKEVPITRIYEVATFYSFLSVNKKGKHIIRVCNSPSCYVNGSESALNMFEKALGVKCGETTKDGKFTLEVTSCIGHCDEAPAAMVDDEILTRLTEEKVKEIIERCK